MAKMKVFRTAIGFHDAYVAAPSMKAALKAWGTTKDLFSRGAAEVVTDAKLTREPLANPGTVFKLSRGSAAEQMAALAKDTPDTPGRTKRPPMSALATPSAPRPDRAALDEAESAIRGAEDQYRGALQDLDAQIDRLKKRRRELDAAHEREATKLEQARSDEEERYRQAMRKWRGS